MHIILFQIYLRMFTIRFAETRKEKERVERKR